MTEIEVKALKESFLAFRGISDFILFQTKTFNIYRIDRKTYDLINLIQSGSSNYTGISVPDDLEKLIEQDISNYEHDKMLPEVRNEYNQTSPEINSLNLFLTDNCNLSCVYCYFNKQDGNSKKPCSSIDLETGYKAIDFYIDALWGTEKPIAINFFGGEPLLQFNKIRNFVEYTKNHNKRQNKGISFYTTTNATLLNTEMIQYFKKNNFYLVVSLDGNEEVHNRNRKTKSGNGTYKTVWNNLIDLAGICPDSVRIRATVTPYYTDVKSMSGHFRQSGIFRYGFELMYDTDYTEDLRWTSEKIDEYKRNYMEYIESIYELIKTEEIEEPEMELISKELMRIKRKSFKHIPCQMGRESITVSTHGLLYPCHWLVNSKDWIIGSLDKGFNSDRNKSYPDLVFDNNTCSKCWARYLCGGGCPAVSIQSNRSKSVPDRWMCKDRKIRWEGILALYAELLIKQNPLISDL